jgi:hypothetical protein
MSNEPRAFYAPNAPQALPHQPTSGELLFEGMDACDRSRFRFTSIVVLATAVMVAGCSGGVKHRMDCDNVLRLRVGQTMDEVRALIGEPRAVGSVGTVWSESGAPRADTVFGYGSSYSGRPVLLGTRDEMMVFFLRGHVVEVSAYRMQIRFAVKKEVGTALLLGSVDLGHGPSEPRHVIGLTFKDVFQCGPDFSLERARAQFDAAQRDVR